MNTVKAVAKNITISTSLPWISAGIIPLLLPGPQLLVGTIVNSLLFWQSRKLNNKKLIILAVLPSIAAVTHGLLFSSFTWFLVYFLPFIWLGNWVLMYIYKKNNSIIYSSLAKAGILTLTAVILVSFKLVPPIFLIAMSLIQLVTALAGGTIVFTLSKKPHTV